MMRQFKILEYALASLLRRKGKNLAILSVYTLTVAVLATVLLLTHALKMEAVNSLAGGPDLVVQKTLAGRHELIPVSAAETVAGIPGVGAVTPRVWGYYYDGLTKANYTLLGIDRSGPELDLLAGRLPQAEGECAIGAGVADTRLVSLGDDLILVDHDNIGRVFTITGLFEHGSDLLTHDLLLLTTSELRRFFGLPEGLATDLAVEVHNPNEINTVARKVKRLLPDSRPITHSEILRTYHAVFDWRSGMILALFASALLAFCILAWDKATGLSAGERREVGILKAVGWDTADVLLLKTWEGLVISMTAFLLGVLLAFMLVFVWGAPVISYVLRGWSVVFPEIRPTPYLDIYQIMTLAFLVIVPYVASTVIPAWKAATTDPDEVMRQ